MDMKQRDGDSRMTVLVVDDSETLVKLLERYLVRRGYRVFTAGNGQEALSVIAADETGIHAVILDINMPVMQLFPVL